MKREIALSPSVHMVQVRDDIVILDIVADRYSCLVGGSAWVTLGGPATVIAEEDVLAELLAAGLVTDNDEPPARRAPQSPEGELSLNDSPGALRRLDTAIRTMAATAAFQGKGLSLLIQTGAPRGRPAAIDARRIAARASAYRAVLPLIPFEGLCLQRAYQLRQVLASDGQAVDWVFGVKTWPFFAHCWLQTGNLVIGDRIERVRSFTPIAVC